MLQVDRSVVEASPLQYLRAAVDRYQCVVLLKGARTLIASADQAVTANVTGVPWLATAGSGDVLSGLIGSLLAAGLEPYDAARVGAWLHGRAGTIASGAGAHPVSAEDIADALPEAAASCFGSA
jgi:NAD(P)H-hydrate repair Nnr-like enzyme with NAD(P)H-hydrate dehydratase domain